MRLLGLALASFFVAISSSAIVRPGAPPCRVSIIGGGLSPSLRHLTAEALEELRAADVILFDSLGPDEGELRRLAPPHAELVPVGKRGGDGPGRPKQERIDELLARHATEPSRDADARDARRGPRVVVRLKGGDPYVFGRARGECDALRKRGIPFRVYPGISSAVAAPLLAGIPLTDAAAGATSFACFSGTDAKGRLGTGGSDDEGIPWDDLGRIDTLVFLMAGRVSKIGAICDALVARAGKSPDTPVALVQSGGGRDDDVPGTSALEPQRVYRATLATMLATLTAVVERERSRKSQQQGELGGSAEERKAALSATTFSPCVVCVGPTAELDLVRGDPDTGKARATGPQEAHGASSVAHTAELARPDEARTGGLSAGGGLRSTAAEILQSHDSFLLDIDGVLWRGGEEIPGALAAVRQLLSRKRVWFVTNNSSLSRAAYAAKLSDKLAVPVSEDMVITSGWAAARFVVSAAEKTANPARGETDGRADPMRAFVLGSEGLLEELRAAGITCVTEDGDDGRRERMDTGAFAALTLDPTIGAVVVGWTPDFDYRQLCVASAYVQRLPSWKDSEREAGPSGDGLFVATNPDPANVVGGLLMPENGAVVAAIEAATGRRAAVAGKPSALLARMVVESHGLDPRRTVMVGDRLDTDVAFANAAGFASVLVLSGVATEDEAAAAVAGADEHSKGGRGPSFVLPSISSLFSDSK